MLGESQCTTAVVGFLYEGEKRRDALWQGILSHALSLSLFATEPVCMRQILLVCLQTVFMCSRIHTKEEWKDEREGTALTCSRWR